jgi:GDP-mannose 6-dehydrogenase
MAKVALFGLGPVGLGTAYQLLHDGHEVHGFDSDTKLIHALSAGQFTRARDLAEELNRFHGRLFFYHESFSTIPKTEAQVICVGTPSQGADLDYSSVVQVFENTLDQLKYGGLPHFILRSTTRPGTVEKLILPILAKVPNSSLSYYPEFLREKFIRDDIKSPPLSVAHHMNSRAKEIFSSLFSAEVSELKSFSEAEAIKIFSNAFHSLKVTFANEVAELCQEMFIDGESVMRVLCSDQKLNISGAYLKPGGPFSGHCLEKDLKCLESFILESKIESPLLLAIRKSNDLRKQHERFSLDA